MKKNDRRCVHVEREKEGEERESESDRKKGWKLNRKKRGRV